MSRAVPFIALAALLACSQPAQQQAAQQHGVPAAGATDATRTTQPASGAVLAPAPPSTSLDPATVVIAWAKAMSHKEWGSAYLYWGDHGARSGLTPAQFAAKWGKLANPEFELHPGTTEGAAGSSYYTAPIVLIDGQRQVHSAIVLRRVNDVDGASAEQLRWHIESLTIEP
jgi:hypothetical protein